MVSQVLQKWIREISVLMKSQITDKSFFQESDDCLVLALHGSAWQVSIVGLPYDKKKQCLRILKHEGGSEIYRVYVAENGYIGTTLWHKSSDVDDLTKQMLVITLS